VDSVIFILRPFTFLNNLNQVYTYHYFLKPFYRDEYKPLYTETVEEQIEKIPYHGFCMYPPILTSNWAPDYKDRDSLNYTFLSPISVEYLKKIQELSRIHNFNLILLPTPIDKKLKKDVEHINYDEIKKNGFEKEFRGFFEKIIYLDDSKFSDGSHLKQPEIYTAFYLKNYIK